MTGMLASVRSVEEARLMAEAGADMIDLKEPSAGVLGALPLETVRSIVGELDGRVLVSATVGDIRGGDGFIGDAVRDMAAAGVDYVKVGLFDRFDFERLLDALSAVAHGGARIVLVTFAEQEGHRVDGGKIAAAGLAGVMVDTKEKRSGSLLQKVPVGTLDSFVRNAHQAGLVCGLAGALRPEDVPDLLPLHADFLGFRSALCKGNERIERVCIRRAQIIRALIPVSTGAKGAPARAPAGLPTTGGA